MATPLRKNYQSALDRKKSGFDQSGNFFPIAIVITIKKILQDLLKKISSEFD